MNNRTSKQYLNIFSSIKITTGPTRSVVADLERQAFHLIPNDMADFLTKNIGNSKNAIYSEYPKIHKDIDEYLSFLQERDIIFFSSQEPSQFPEIQNEWDSYSLITNTTLEIESSKHLQRIDLVNSTLSKLNCQYLEIRFLWSPDMSDIHFILDAFRESIIRGIVLTMPVPGEMTKVEELLNKHPRLMHVNLYGDSFPHLDLDDKHISFILADDPRMACGSISAKGFAPTIQAFTESREHNSCLNRKLSLNLDSGSIRNCGSMNSSFGSFYEDDIIQIISSQSFQKYWKITKSQINVCQDCEFRNICTDCRVFIEDPDNIKSKPLKCGYDPYTGNWVDWKSQPEKMHIFKQIENNQFSYE